MIQVFLQNDRSFRAVEEGSSLLALAQSVCPEVKDDKTEKRYPVLAALVDHKLKELSFNIFYPHEITFIGYNHPDGRRTYIRSLCFVLQHAARTLFPDRGLRIEHSLASGMYCELIDNESGRPVKPTSEELNGLREKMRELVEADRRGGCHLLSAAAAAQGGPPPLAWPLFLPRVSPRRADGLLPWAPRPFYRDARRF